MLKERLTLQGLMSHFSKAESAFQASIVLQQELYGHSNSDALQKRMPGEVREVFDHFELGDGGVINLEILQNIYIKNLRFLAYDPVVAIDNLKKFLVLSDFICGPAIKYKHS